MRSWIDLFSKEKQNPFSDSFGFENPVLDFLKETHHFHEHVTHHKTITINREKRNIHERSEKIDLKDSSSFSTSHTQKERQTVRRLSIQISFK